MKKKTAKLLKTFTEYALMNMSDTHITDEAMHYSALNHYYRRLKKQVNALSTEEKTILLIQMRRQMDESGLESGLR